jgi:hypothetical protein
VLSGLLRHFWVLGAQGCTEQRIDGRCLAPDRLGDLRASDDRGCRPEDGSIADAGSAAVSLVAEIVLPARGVQDIDRRDSVRVAYAAPVAVKERRPHHGRDPYRRCGQSRKCEPREQAKTQREGTQQRHTKLRDIEDGSDIMMLWSQEIRDNHGSRFPCEENPPRHVCCRTESQAYP